jgi:hypothetical protein
MYELLSNASISTTPPFTASESDQRTKFNLPEVEAILFSGNVIDLLDLNVRVTSEPDDFTTFSENIIDPLVQSRIVVSVCRVSIVTLRASNSAASAEA